MAQETLINMLEDSRYSYLIVRKTSRSIRISVFRLLVEMINKYNLGGFFRVNRSEMSITGANGSSLITSGLDDVEKLKSVANVNRIWIEEASEVTEQDFNQLDLRMRGTSQIGYQMSLTFNPISESHWLKERFFDKGDKQAYVLKTTYEDNPFLDDQYIQTLMAMKEKDYQYYLIYAKGEWGTTGKKVFTNWEVKELDRHELLKENNELQSALGVDYGFTSDPSTMIVSLVDEENRKLYIIDEMYVFGYLNNELAEEIKDMGYSRERIIADSAEKKSIEEMQGYGIPRIEPAKKGPGSVNQGIQFIKQFDIYVDPSCEHTIGELENYAYRQNKQTGKYLNEPIDNHNHLLDALRYSLEPFHKKKKSRKIQTLPKSIFGI